MHAAFFFLINNELGQAKLHLKRYVHDWKDSMRLGHKAILN